MTGYRWIWENSLNVDEYRKYYLDLTLGTFGGNQAHFDCSYEVSNEREVAIEKSRKTRQRQIVFHLVSLIETEFLSHDDMRALRKFLTLASVPAAVNSTHLSCFIYIRDCVGHHASAKLFAPTQPNTMCFANAVASGTFPHVTLNGDFIDSANTHELHLIVLRFFGQSV